MTKHEPNMKGYIYRIYPFFHSYTHMQTETFSYNDEQFADLQMLRYRVDGFDRLSIARKN